jgi:hypothetical protein
MQAETLPRPRVILQRNPFDPMRREAFEVRGRARIRRYVPRNRPAIALLNGKPVLRAGWNRRLRRGDRLMVVVLPRGGGAGRGSDPLRTVLSLALLVVAPMAAGAILGVAGTAAGLAGTATLFGGFTVGQALALGIVVGGQALVNALLPPPVPQQQQAPSPTYSLQAQGNLARIEQPIPVQYGRMKSYPDLAAQPYTQFEGEEQFLYQLFCLGVGEYEIEQTLIEDTPIESFSEIETEVIGPSGQVTLFPTSVVTSVEVSGQDFPGRKSGTWSRTGTVLTVTETAHGRVTGQAVQIEITSGTGPADDVYQIATVPDADTFTLTVSTGSGSGNVNIRSVLGGIDGFVASGPDTDASALAIDIVLPRGLYDVDGGGNRVAMSISLAFEAREVDNDGLPVGSWASLGTVDITDQTATPIRRSYRWDTAAAGRYRVRAWRVDAKSTAAEDAHDVIWYGLRAFLQAPEDFGPVTLIAMRARATNNLSAQASRQVGVIATRKLPIWNGTTWSAPTASRSIAWALADHARGTETGAGLADARIDLASLLALDAIWQDRGDRFDGRFDTASNWWEAATRIATAGRSKVFLQGGILRFVRDGAETVPVAAFSMRNIIRDSFEVDYIFQTGEVGEAVEVRYWDGTVWADRRVTAVLPDGSADNPMRIDLFGVTDRAQALREGMYQAAANKYRRRLVRFRTEMEGFIPSIGDLIAIQHDTPGWGAHAQVVAWDAGTRVVTLTEPTDGLPTPLVIGFRRRDGSLSGPWAATAGPGQFEATLAAVPDITPESPADREATHVLMGAETSWRTLAKVVHLRPDSGNTVLIECVTEDPNVHTAEDGVVAPALRLSSLPRAIVLPVVAGLIARTVPDDTTQALLSWQPATGAETYQIEMADGDNPAAANVSWTRVADTSAAHQLVPMLFATRTLVRVRGIGLAAGPWVGASLGSLLDFYWPADARPFGPPDDADPFRPWS